MRICLITGLYPPHARGGSERVVHEEAKALKKAGHRVSVITTEDVRDDGSIDPRMTVEDGVRVYRFYPFNLFFYGKIGRYGALTRSAWHLWDLVNPHTTSSVRKIFEKERPEVVHTHNLKGIGFSIPKLIKKMGIRHVHTLHDVQLSVPSGLVLKGEEDKADSFPNRLYSRVMRRLMGSPDVVISPSNFLLKWYVDRKFFPDSQLTLLPNPTPVIESPSHEASKETRFLYLGQIEPHKGLFWLISVMKEYFERDPNIKLDIVGEGSALEEAVALAGQDMRFTFYGKKRLSEFAQMFSQSDYTILPSLCYENAPTVIGESFAYGVPVIAARIGGATEMIREGENGFEFEAGNKESLMNAMEDATAFKKNWDKLSRSAKRTSELRSSVHHVSRLLKLYGERDMSFDYLGPVVPIRSSKHKKITVSSATEKMIETVARKHRVEGRKKKTKAKPGRKTKQKVSS